MHKWRLYVFFAKNHLLNVVTGQVVSRDDIGCAISMQHSKTHLTLWSIILILPAFAAQNWNYAKLCSIFFLAQTFCQTRNEVHKKLNNFSIEDLLCMSQQAVMLAKCVDLDQYLFMFV